MLAQAIEIKACLSKPFKIGFRSTRKSRESESIRYIILGNLENLNPSKFQFQAKLLEEAVGKLGPD